MLNASLLNLGSLILGIAAWVLAIVGIIAPKSEGARKLVFSTISMGACAGSICLQTFYSRHLVRIEDWSALTDTASAVAFVCAVLFGVSVLLNALSVYFYYKRKGV